MQFQMCRCTLTWALWEADLYWRTKKLIASPVLIGPLGYANIRIHNALNSYWPLWFPWGALEVRTQQDTGLSRPHKPSKYSIIRIIIRSFVTKIKKHQSFITDLKHGGPPEQWLISYSKAPAISPVLQCMRLNAWVLFEKA